jgi:GTP-binding protein HflX
MHVHGRTLGLKKSHIRALERLAHRRVTGSSDVTPEIARDLTELSLEIGRRIGILLDRRGKVVQVCLGDRERIPLPDSVRASRQGKGRLSGLRLVHTRFSEGGPSQADLTDLIRFRLDLTTAIEVADDGLPGAVHRAHLLPRNREGRAHELLGPGSIHGEEFAFREVLQALEEELARTAEGSEASKGRERAILVAVTTGSPDQGKASLQELADLARSSGAEVVEEVLQRRPRLDGRTLVGSGMLRELQLLGLRAGADLVIFDRDLTPAQARNIERELNTKVIDRSQLILDIFAQRAVSAEGKLQVELARLQYMLPHLTYGRASLAQIRGGIGSNRGVGEKKSELDRRTVRERVQTLRRRIDELSRTRENMRKRRREAEVAVVALVGYTNAGKSTLFNRLTGAGVLARDQLFATLSTTARRLDVPGRGQVVLTDTVGFISDLPAALVAAFRATLEETGEARLLLHVADASSDRVWRQIDSVRKILRDMSFHEIPAVLLLNKRDLVDEEALGPLARSEEGLLVSARSDADLDRIRAVVARALAGGAAGAP